MTKQELLEAALVELGHAARPPRDEEDSRLVAELSKGRKSHLACLARRGWVTLYDRENFDGYAAFILRALDGVLRRDVTVVERSSKLANLVVVVTVGGRQRCFAADRHAMSRAPDPVLLGALQWVTEERLEWVAVENDEDTAFIVALPRGLPPECRKLIRELRALPKAVVLDAAELDRDERLEEAWRLLFEADPAVRLAACEKVVLLLRRECQRSRAIVRRAGVDRDAAVVAWAMSAAASAFAVQAKMGRELLDLVEP